MALLTIRQTVRDYGAWRVAYDALGEVRHDWGVTADAVYQLADAPDTVLVLHHFATAAQARGFLTCRAVGAAMRRAGAGGPPASRSIRSTAHALPGPTVSG